MVEHIHFGFQRAAFPAEFAAFVRFVGGTEIDRLIERVARKLRSLSPETRHTLGDRYYFHQEFARFARNGFQLDTSRFEAVRAASVIATVNHISGRASPVERKQLRSRMLDALDPGRDVREIEHELRCYTHLARKRHRLALPASPAKGKRIFDWLVTTTSGREVEVECKTIGEDAALQIKSDLRNDLYETFGKFARTERFGSSGLLTLQLRRPAALCKGLASRLREILRSDVPLPHCTDDFTLSFEPRPQWQSAFEAGGVDGVAAAIAAELGNEAYSFCGLGRSFLAIIFKPHRVGAVGDHVVDVLRDAGHQFSGSRPAVIWLHFTGLGQSGFRELVEASRAGQGLNALAGISLQDRTGQPDRKHVERILFSADPDSVTRSTALAPNLMIEPAVSVDGMVFEVINPYCMFPMSDIV